MRMRSISFNYFSYLAYLKHNKMESKKTGFLIVVLLGLLAIIVAGTNAWGTLKFRHLAIQTEGTVIGGRSISDPKQKIYKYSVSYISKNGKEDTTKIYTKDSFLKAGEKIQIYYDPASKFASLNVSIFKNVVGIIIGLIFLRWGYPNYRMEVKKESARVSS
jgi:hypothetical protein